MENTINFSLEDYLLSTGWEKINLVQFGEKVINH